MMPDNTNQEHSINSSSSCPEKGEVACKNCKLFGFLQLFEGLHLNALDVFLSSHQEIGKGETLFSVDDPFRGVYAVKSGSLKSISMLELQGEQILGFYLPGELLALDAIYSSTYGYNAVAMEASTVCLLSFQNLQELGERFAQFQELVIQVLVDQVKQDQRQTLLVGRRTAEERLGTFFLNLAERYARHGFSDNEFRMPMLQNDIANYLGMTIETVSRTLRSFRENELLHIKGKQVRILNPACLQSITQYCLTGQSGKERLKK